MKLTYSLSKEHLQVFGKLSCQRLSISRGKRTLLTSLNIVGWAGIAFGTAAIVGIYKSAPDLSGELNSVFISFALAVVVLVVSLCYQQRLRSNAMLSEGSWLRVRQTVFAGSDALEIEVPGVRVRYEWSRFSEVLEDAAAIYLFLDVAHAVIVPKVAFATPDDMHGFLSWAKSSSKLPHAAGEARA